MSLVPMAMSKYKLNDENINDIDNNDGDSNDDGSDDDLGDDCFIAYLFTHRFVTQNKRAIEQGQHLACGRQDKKSKCKTI